MISKIITLHLFTGSVLENGMRVPIFSQPSGKVYSYESQTRRIIARNPLMPDPWESDQVYVKESQLPQGGEGLYAKKDLDKAELISLFNGVRLKTATLESKNTESDYRLVMPDDDPPLKPCLTYLGADEKI